MRARSLHVLVGSLAVAGFAAACGAEGESSVFGNGGGPDASVEASRPGPDLDMGDASSDANAQSLRIEPATTVVNVTGTFAAPIGSATLKAYVNGSSTSVAASWSLDNVALGTIDSAGVFTARPVAGSTTITARVGTLTATAVITVNVSLSENLANVSTADQARLRAGGTADAAAFKWLYPYDKTVFPRGLPAPKLQFGGEAPDAYRVHVKSKLLEYEGFFPGGSGAARVTLTEEWWKAVSASAGASDPITVEVTKLASGAVTGPIKETWSIAQGSLKGTVFYNSYNSAMAGNVGAVLRIKPGKRAEVFIGKAQAGGSQQGCVVCHSVNATGTTLVTGINWADTPAEQGGNPMYSGVFGISASGAAQAKYVDDDGRKFAFGAVSPDGAWLVGNGVPKEYPNVRGLNASVGYGTRVYDGATGQAVNDAYFGAGTERFALMPMFSPDGKRLAFTDRSASPGRTIALLDFNGAASPPQLAGYTQIVSSTSTLVGWPTFTPDSKALLYHEGDAFDTAQHSDTAVLGKRTADLKWVDIATKKIAALDALNGFAANSAGALEFYLPYGESSEGHLNYEPTLLPSAVGGYYWVVFTSRRSYGNTIYDGPNSINAAGDRPFDNGDRPGRGYRKKLWVAAIDIDAPPGTDPSHPAFFLEGQEAEAGNMRGFWALDPCKQVGNDCETGDECCGGFCRQVSAADGGIAKQCVATPQGCANDSERCNVDADCCSANGGVRCINHSCASLSPPR